MVSAERFLVRVNTVNIAGMKCHQLNYVHVPLQYCSAHSIKINVTFIYLGINVVYTGFSRENWWFLN
jgi:hypothetical protein